MIGNHMLLTASMYELTDVAACASHAGLVAMNTNTMLGIGYHKTFRVRLMAHGSTVPISWGRPPDKIDR